MGRRQRARMRGLAVAPTAVERQEWFRIVNKAASREATVYLYDEIGFFGTSAADFASEVAGLDVDTITLFINSPGGEVYDGVTIFNTLRRHKATVNVVVDGLAASAASFIAQAGDKRTMTRNSTMMIHDASTLAWGDAAEMRRTADLLDKASSNIADIYAQRCGKDPGYWRDLMTAETWFDAAEAVEFGLADEVEGTEPAESAQVPKATWDLSVYRYAGRSQAPAPAALHTEPVQPEATAEIDSSSVNQEPVSEVPVVEDKYDPAQRRGDDGKWSDGFPGEILSTVLDTAKGRIGVSRGGDGSTTLHVGDGTVTLTADEFAAVADWPHTARDLNKHYFYDVESGGRTKLAFARSGDDEWELGIADGDDEFAHSIDLTGTDVDRLGDTLIQIDGAQRVPVEGGRMDMWPAGNGQAGLRVRGSDENRTVTEVKVSDREFGELHTAVRDLHDYSSSRADVATAGADDDEDAPQLDETDADTTRIVQTAAGPLTVELVGDTISITPAGDAWRVRLSGDQQSAWIDAATATSEALDLLGADAFNRAIRAMTCTRTHPQPRLRAGADSNPWADLVAHLITSVSATEVDPLARLREAYK
jgi:ATP-dependent Clp endopeptidase proteolytic subunit ClpP